ncbi:MAG: hypothetical protein ACTSYU_12605 [Promethearchaeota archaeon]
MLIELSMYRPSNSDSYNTDYLAWPDHISRRCNICGTPLKFAHADNGKLIHTLDGDIQQVAYKYTCPNEKCENFKRYFNPAPRYDYDQHYFGKDVLNRISREIFVFKQNPGQIHLRLTLDYSLNISLRTVQRMYNDCILVKADRIDKNTEEQITDNKGIVMAADAQDPGAGMDAIWLFTDCLTGRVFHTKQSKTMPSEKLQIEIQGILAKFNTPLLGFVSDKQGSIVTCMKNYFPQVPHQYCTWHFASHLWDHMEFFDAKIYASLKSGLTNLYIHGLSTTTKAYFAGSGKLYVREVFAEIDNDLQKLLKYRSKRFRSLRGLAIYRSLKRFVKDMEETGTQITANDRFGKIFFRTIDVLKVLLESVQERFFESLFMYDTFKVIYFLLYMPILERADRQQQLDHVFGKVWAVARIKAPTMTLDALRSFQPVATSACPKILGEWVRLWNSYLPGLFQYYDFPITRRTNMAQEQAFSVEKTALNRRMANSEVGFMQELQGEFYLRFCHCTQEELRNDIVEEYMSSEIDILRAAYHQKVKKVVENWFYRAEPLKGIESTVKKYGNTEIAQKIPEKKKKTKKSYREAIREKKNTGKDDPKAQNNRKNSSV